MDNSIEGYKRTDVLRVNIQADFMMNKLYCVDKINFNKGDIVLSEEGKKYQSRYTGSGGNRMDDDNSWEPVK